MQIRVVPTTAVRKNDVISPFSLNQRRSTTMRGQRDPVKWILVCGLLAIVWLFYTGLSCTRQPLIVVVTPTYKTPHRLADMTRLSNTLRLVEDVHWLVVEDGDEQSDLVASLLARSRIPNTYLVARTQEGYPKKGWWQREQAILHLREHAKDLQGTHSSLLVYFADDDNAYDTRLFDDYIRRVKRAGVWAVGLSGNRRVETPLTSAGRVIGWDAWEAGKRTFALDMAGFAVDMRLLMGAGKFNNGKGCAMFGPESCFLESLGLRMGDVEPFGLEKETGREVYVWHTRTTSSVNKKVITPLGFDVEE